LAVLEAAAGLRAALAGFEPGELSASDAAHVAEELAATEKACAAMRLLTANRTVAAGVHANQGYADPAVWLARQSGITPHQARRDLHTAERLADCPSTRQALLAGDISLAQAEEITRAEAETAGVEASLLDAARDGDLAQLRDRAREERQGRTPVDDLHDQQRKARMFRHWKDRLGMIRFGGGVTPEVGLPLIKRIEEGVERIRRDERARARAEGVEPDLEPWERYAADALADLCLRPDPAVGDKPARKRAGRTELVIVCDLFAWRRGHTHAGEVCHLVDGGPIPVPVAQDWADDAFIKVVIHDGVNIHTIHHAGRYLSAELRTALDLGPVPEFTGRTCVDCGSRWNLEYDHVNPVANDGLTEYDNLQPRCWADHQAKTERDRQAGFLGPNPPTFTTAATVGPDPPDSS
jgi:hypothetical protein